MISNEWTTEKIAEAFKRFIEKNGYMPSAHEIDDSDYFPSARQIQRKFGGLQKIREILGYTDIHLGRGTHRSVIAQTIGKRGRLNELELEVILKNHFGEFFVHTERRYGKLSYRVDFYVYCPEGNFGVDIFETHRFDNLHNNLNLKFKRYTDFREILYFVVKGKAEWTQIDLDNKCLSKINIKNNYKVITLKDFTELISTKPAYRDPRY